MTFYASGDACLVLDKMEEEEEVEEKEEKAMRVRSF